MDKNIIHLKTRNQTRSIKIGAEEQKRQAGWLASTYAESDDQLVLGPENSSKNGKYGRDHNDHRADRGKIPLK